MEKVSIIITTFNRKKYIRTAVKSALMQTYPKTETIVVDGSINFKTSELLNDYNDDILIIKDHKRVGVGAARNL